MRWACSDWRGGCRCGYAGTTLCSGISSGVWHPRPTKMPLALMEGSTEPQVCIDAYREWTKLGATVVASLVRAGETARDASCSSDEGS
jgi:hypothetical protein